GDDGANTLAGTGGIDNMHGAKGNDLMQAAGGNDYVFGEGGHDTLEGGAGDDWLEGGSSNDMMDGGLGNDTLVASRGKDELTGGADADVFLFKDTIRKATITDFEDGIDLIDLSRMEAARNMDDIEVEQVAANEYTLFFGNDAGKETVVQVLSASNVALDQNDFLF
ncbi:MAG: calcium-binding protein, partial [Pseudomonadota bacterium]